MNNSEGGNLQKAGAGVRGGHIQTAPAQLQVGAVGFGPMWTMEDSMAASIIRLEQENQELRARVAVLEEEQRILARKYAPRLTDDDDDYVQLTEKGRALLEVLRG